MLPTIQQRTHVDHSCEYPAAAIIFVPINSDSLQYGRVICILLGLVTFDASRRGKKELRSSRDINARHETAVAEGAEEPAT